jgi:hypothetical protein
MTNFSARVEMFYGSNWVSFGRDLLRPWSFIRGNSARGPRDILATTGTFTFVLNNSAYSTGGAGYYSPNHPNNRPGFGYGTLVRLVLRDEDNGYEQVRWTGKIRDIDAAPGLHGAQTTRVVADDLVADIAATEIREVGPQLNKNEVELFEAVIAAIPETSRPLGTNFDAPIGSFTVALDDLGSGVQGLSVFERIVSSVQGRMFVDGAGILRYVNKTSMQLKFPNHVFQPGECSISVPTNLADVYNRIRITLHPKTFTDVPIQLAEHVGELAIPPGGEQTFWMSYKHPSFPDINIGGVDFITPVPVTDYMFTPNADGSGGDANASMTVTVGFFTTSAVVTLKNNAIIPLYKQYFKVRGTGIYDLSSYFVQSYEERPYGNREFKLDLPYKDNALDATAHAQFLRSTFIDQNSQIAAISFHPQRSDVLMAQAILSEITDVYEASDPQILPGGGAAVVNAIELMCSEENILTCRFIMTPWIVEPIGLNDVVGVDDELTYDAAAPENRIGFAKIGFSEIG